MYSVTQSCLTLCNPMDFSPQSSSVHGIFPGKNTGVGYCFLHLGILPAQGLNPRLLHLLHWRADSLAPGKPKREFYHYIYRSTIFNEYLCVDIAYVKYTFTEYLLCFQLISWTITFDTCLPLEFWKSKSFAGDKSYSYFWSQICLTSKTVHIIIMCTLSPGELKALWCCQNLLRIRRACSQVVTPVWGFKNLLIFKVSPSYVKAPSCML